MRTGSAIAECTNCNARISRGVSECPWCGYPQTPNPDRSVTRRLTLGALLTILTLAAILAWLMTLDRPPRNP